MTDLEALAGLVEQATEAEQATVLSDAWDALGPIVRWTGHQAGRFGRMIDAEAYESAAMMLVPEGWYASYICQERRDPGVWYVALRLPGGLVHADCKTRGLALAITAAVLRGRAQAQEADRG